jgi:hypothetical protein
MLSSSELAAVEFSDWISEITAAAAWLNGVTVSLVGATNNAISVPLLETYWGVVENVSSLVVPRSARTLANDELDGA